MKTYQKIITGGLALAGLVGLFGCDNKKGNSEGESIIPSHFATVPMSYETGLDMTSGDFDDDGDLDLIVGARPYGVNEGRLYFLRNQNGLLSEPSHFATVPMSYETGLAMTSGDFDDDGDLDLIVGARPYGVDEGRLYRFKNNGEGKFSQ